MPSGSPTTESKMACIDPDGTLTVTATVLLEKLSVQSLPEMEISMALGVPLFMLRANLREMAGLGFIREEDDLYHITEEGRAKL